MSKISEHERGHIEGWEDALEAVIDLIEDDMMMKPCDGTTHARLQTILDDVRGLLEDEQ